MNPPWISYDWVNAWHTWSSLEPLGALLDGQPVRSRTWGCRLVLDYSFSDWSNTAVVL